MPDLSKLAREERKKLTAKAAASGSVPKDDLEALDRLEKLAAGDHSWHQWWIPACAFLLPLLVVTSLVWSEQKETQIDLVASVTSFTATWRDKQPLFESALLRELKVTDSAGVDNLSADGGPCSVDVRLDAKPGPSDAINLQLVELPKGWRIGPELIDSSIEMTLSGPQAKSVAPQEEAPTTVSVSGHGTINRAAAATTNAAKSRSWTARP